MKDPLLAHLSESNVPSSIKVGDEWYRVWGEFQLDGELVHFKDADTFDVTVIRVADIRAVTY